MTMLWVAVACLAATMCAMVTPIMAVDRTRSGCRKASRYWAASALPSSARWRIFRRLAAMKAISTAEKNMVASRHSADRKSVV